jgi:hypothetical protein
VGRPARTRGRKRPAAQASSWAAGKEEKEKRAGGGVGRKGGKGKGERFGFFFLNFFKIIFQTFKLHSNKKPCIRIFIISNFI